MRIRFRVLLMRKEYAQEWAIIMSPRNLGAERGISGFTNSLENKNKNKKKYPPDSGQRRSRFTVFYSDGALTNAILAASLFLFLFFILNQ